MVMQRVHLKTLSPLGHLDIAPHVMQLPDAKSLSVEGLPFTFDGPAGCVGLLCLDPGPKPNISASESESESKSSGDGFFWAVFLLEENKDGKGWLMERPWLDGLGLGAVRCSTGSVGTKSGGTWAASTRFGSLGRKELATGLRAGGLDSCWRTSSSSGRGSGGSGGSREGGSGRGSLSREGQGAMFVLVCARGRTW